MRYILLSIVFFACKTPAISTDDCIGKLKIELEKNWKFIADPNYYASRNIYSIDTTYRNCIQGLDSNQVINLFGKPTRVYTPSVKKYPYTIEYALSNGAYQIIMVRLNNVISTIPVEYHTSIQN